MKIATIIGARPQFIKAATVSRAFREHHSDVSELLLHTGQHYDANMSAIFFDELDIPKPAYNLGIGGGTHGQNTGRMIEQIEKVLMHEKPDAVLVYGDTDSTLAGTLAAVKLHIPIAHVEAGLRSFNRAMPEEINRILTDHSSNFLFTPTNIATSNLANEGIPADHILQVGDVMYDAALYYGVRAQQRSQILDNIEIEPKNYVLATIHRAENTNDKARMQGIVSGFANSSRTIVLPLHPRTKKCLKNHGIKLSPNVKVVEPVGYLDMVMLEVNSALIVTDSGGVQKEAYFHGVPCLTLRDETEWKELVDIGANSIVGYDHDLITDELDKEARPPILKSEMYGTGDASLKITNILASFNL
jgi:UDP-GlcNAc3NAcA epimerase